MPNLEYYACWSRTGTINSPRNVLTFTAINNQDCLLLAVLIYLLSLTVFLPETFGSASHKHTEGWVFFICYAVLSLQI